MITFSFLIEGLCLPTVSSFGFLGKIVVKDNQSKKIQSELSTEQLKRQQVNPRDTWESLLGGREVIRTGSGINQKSFVMPKWLHG